MNEFDNNISPENNENTDSSTVSSESKENNNVESGGITHNSDGTYHGVPTQNDAAERPSQNAPYGEAHANGASQSPTGAPPYGSSNSYPYGNNRQGGYPYGNYYRNNSYNYQQPNNMNGGYPYGNNSQQGANPYMNRNEQYHRNDGYAYSQNEGKGKGTKTFAIVAGVLCVLLVVILVVLIISDRGSEPENETTTTPEGVSQNTDEIVMSPSDETDGTVVGENGELHPKAIYQKVLPSSVGILVYDKDGSLNSEGSGVLFTESNDGKYTYIATCAHVINGRSVDILVQVHDGKEYTATVVGYDTRTDIGVLRIEETGFTLADFGDSSKIAVGDPIYAIGNPGGVEFANSFTNGMVSALDRPVNSSETGYTTDCIQHTAAINPGNSGGALVNAFGQVIGINSMKIVADEYEGMGFAVPSSVFVEIINEIMTNGYVTNRPKLGITYIAASEYGSYGMFVAIKGLPSGSIIIYEIADDSSLVDTEAETGDLIVAVNGTDLDDPSYLAQLIEDSEIGDELVLSIVRVYDDYTYDEFDVTVTLVEDKGDMIVSEEEETTEKNRLPDYLQ